MRNKGNRYLLQFFSKEGHFLRKFACNIFSYLSRLERVALLTLVIYAGLFNPLSAEQSATAHRPFTSSISLRVSALWKGQSLGLVLDRLTTTQGITFWIDRRIDIQQSVDLHVREMALGEVLDVLTKDRSLGWFNLGSVCYIGPRAAAQEIATLLQLAKKPLERMPIAKKKIWTQKEAVSWPRLSEPRLLLSSWLDEKGISLKNPALITHDLWPAKQLPPISLIERVVLLLNGFDLTCQISPDGDQCTVIPIDRPLSITHSYEVDGNASAIIEQMKREAPQLKISQRGKELLASGVWEDHLKLRKLLYRERPSTRDKELELPNSSRQLFSLRLQNQPLGNVVSRITQQVGLDLEWDEPLLISRDGVQDLLVSCDVQEVELPALLRSLLEPVGIDFRLEDGKVFLFAPTE